jgi:hypothetical protein
VNPETTKKAVRVKENESDGKRTRRGSKPANAANSIAHREKGCSEKKNRTKWKRNKRTKNEIRSMGDRKRERLLMRLKTNKAD